MHFYYDIAAPGRTRVQNHPPCGRKPGLGSSILSRTFRPRRGRLFDRRSRPGNRPAAGAHFGVVGGLSCDRLCGQHAAVAPTFQFGRLPSAGVACLSVFRATSSLSPDSVGVRRGAGRCRTRCGSSAPSDFINASVVARSRDLVDKIRNEDVTAVLHGDSGHQAQFGRRRCFLGVRHADVDGLVPLKHAMSLAVPPERSSGDDRTDDGRVDDIRQSNGG